MLSLSSLITELERAGCGFFYDGPRTRSQASPADVLETLIAGTGEDLGMQYYNERRLVNGIPLYLVAYASELEHDLPKIREDIVNATGYLVETTAAVLRHFDAYKEQLSALERCATALKSRARSVGEHILPKNIGPSRLSELRKSRTDIAKEWQIIDYNREAEFAEKLLQQLNYIEGAPRVYELPQTTHE
jgi:hypothetical protein